MVNYLDSRRIAGTTAERSSIPIPATSGGWVELGRTTLGADTDDLTVSGLSNKRYLHILCDLIPNGAIGMQGRFNSDTGSNYAYRRSNDGGADGTGINQTVMIDGASTETSASGTSMFVSKFVSNYASKEKLTIDHAIVTTATGAGTAPNRREAVNKWANTSNPISSFTAHNYGAGNYTSGSEVVVLGWDPSDTHTTNFWEELADVTLGSAGDTLSSGTITAKKYLWVQVYTKATGGTIQQRMRFNSDSGNNYSERYSQDGGADGVITNDGELLLSAAPSTPAFTNMFIINNQSNEKLVIGHNVNQGGVGAGNDPERFEFTHKWANTSNQITQIDIINTGTGDFDTNSFIKVWGSD